MATFAQNLGRTIDTVGKKLGNPLPDFGISERLVGPVKAATNTLKPSGTSYNPNQYGSPIGPTLPSYSGGGGGGGGGGGNVLGANSGYNSAPEIPQPGGPGIDFDSLIAPALQALEEAIAPLQQSYEGDVSGINSRLATQKATANQQFGEQQATLGRQRTGQEVAGENSVNEQRRGLSEINQGLQARYGGSTGTGAFASEIAGSETLRNIGSIRQTLSQNLQGIDDKLVQVKELGRIAQQDLEDKASDQIRSAKSNLDMQLADIRRQKGELQSRKAELASNALQIYQQTVNQVNASNAQFKQQLYSQQLAAEQALQQSLQKGSAAIQSLSLQNVMLPGQKSPVALGYNNKTNTFSQPTMGGNLFQGSLTDQTKQQDEQLF